jgi:hypothetical protein
MDQDLHLIDLSRVKTQDYNLNFQLLGYQQHLRYKVQWQVNINCI